MVKIRKKETKLCSAIFVAWAKRKTLLEVIRAVQILKRLSSGIYFVTLKCYKCLKY